MAKKKAAGDVLGLSRAPIKQLPKIANTRTRRPKGIEIGFARSKRRAGVVGGVRVRGRS
jgi:hypothetical protein